MIRGISARGTAFRSLSETIERPLSARLLGVCLVAATIVGCGARGQERYDLSGTITSDGLPVPAGYIVFSPDASQGHSGPGSQSDIQAGRYHVPAEQGVLGGAYLATIYGFDGHKILVDHMINPLGKPLFVGHRVAIDLPRQASVKDFDLHDLAAADNHPRK